MKIAIIEKGHFEVAYTLIRLFDEDANHLTIFIDEQSYNQLKYLLQEKISRYTWIIQKKEANRAFIREIFEYNQRNNIDLLYFNTIADNFIFYAWYLKKIRPKKVILTLHDINGFFYYPGSLNLRKAIRFFGKRKLIKIIPAFNLLSESLIPSLQKKLQHKKPILNIPGAIFEPGSFTAQKYSASEIIKIAVPGSVDKRRRNYDLIFELLEKARSAGINIDITLLGTFRNNYSKSIHEKCIGYLQSYDNLHIYDTDIVDQQEFDRVMKETHFVWMPLNQFAVVTDGTKEEYGVSISTGNVGDVVRHARPFFAPSYLPIDSYLEKSCCRYADTIEIIGQLRNLTSQAYEHLQAEALNASLDYTKDKIIERNKSIFK